MPRRLRPAAYARHRGVSRQAVHYAIAVGRIRLGADGLVDVASADRAWAASTSPINGGRRPSARRKPRKRAAPAGATAAAVPTIAPLDAGASSPGVPIPRALAVAAGLLPGLPSEPRPEDPAEADEPQAPAPGQGLISAKTTREEWAGKLAELSYRERAGELLERDEVHRLLGDVAREIRDSLYGIPSRLSNVLAAETVPAAVHELLDQEITQALGALSRGFEATGAEEAAS
jgi:hypothetical protein